MFLTLGKGAGPSYTVAQQTHSTQPRNSTPGHLPEDKAVFPFSGPDRDAALMNLKRLWLAAHNQVRQHSSMQAGGAHGSPAPAVMLLTVEWLPEEGEMVFLRVEPLVS